MVDEGLRNWATIKILVGHADARADSSEQACLAICTCVRRIHAISVAALAQLVEHRIRNAGVTGSSPVGGTIFCLTSNVGRSHPRPWLSSQTLAGDDSYILHSALATGTTLRQRFNYHRNISRYELKCRRNAVCLPRPCSISRAGVLCPQTRG